MTPSETVSGVSSPACSVMQSHHAHDLPDLRFEPLKIEASHLSSLSGFADSTSQNTGRLFPMAAGRHAFNIHAEISMDTKKERVPQRNFQCQKTFKVEKSHLSTFSGFADSPRQNVERLCPSAGSMRAPNAGVTAARAEILVEAKKERIRQIKKQCQTLIAEQNQIRKHHAEQRVRQIKEECRTLIAEQNEYRSHGHEQSCCYKQVVELQLMQAQPLRIPVQPMLADTLWPYQVGLTAPKPRIRSAPCDGYAVKTTWHHQKPLLAEEPFAEVLTDAVQESSCKQDFIGDLSIESIGESTDEGCAGSRSVSDECLRPDSSACSPTPSTSIVDLNVIDNASIGSDELQNRLTLSSSELPKHNDANFLRLGRTGHDQYAIKSDDLVSEKKSGAMWKSASSGSSFAEGLGDAMVPKGTPLAQNDATELAPPEILLSRHQVKCKCPPAPHYPQPPPVVMPLQNCTDYIVAPPPGLQTPVACAVEPPPALPLIAAPQHPILGENPRTSNAKSPQTPSSPALDRGTHRLSKSSEELVDALEWSHDDIQSVTPDGMISFSCVDTLRKGHKNVFCEPSDVLLELPAKEMNPGMQHSLSEDCTFDVTPSSIDDENVNEKQELTSSACRSPSKLHGKVCAHPRRRNKKHAACSTPAPSPSFSAIPHVANSWHRSWLFVLLAVAMASYAGQIFYGHGLHDSMATDLQIPNKSQTWAATLPHEAFYYSRNRRITWF